MYNNTNTSFIRCCVVLAFALLVSICTVFTVYPSVTIEGVIGGSVVLPCASSKNEHNRQDTEVHWRHNDSIIVYGIIRGRNFLKKQNSLYKDRAESFPEEFVKGNFSIKLENLTHTDAGKYKCCIIHSAELVIVELLFKEAEGNLAGKAMLMSMKILIPVLCILLLLSCIVCIARKMKGGEYVIIGHY